MVVLVGVAREPDETAGGSPPPLAASHGATATQSPVPSPSSHAPASTSSAPPTPALGAPKPTAPPTGLLTLGQLLALLPTETEDRTGYDRDLFNHWIDADGDGCDTRREVLIQEAVAPPAVGSGCSLTGGQWVSLYDGLVFTDPGGLDIDHVVASFARWFPRTPDQTEGWAPDDLARER